MKGNHSIRSRAHQLHLDLHLQQLAFLSQIFFLPEMHPILTHKQLCGYGQITKVPSPKLHRVLAAYWQEDSPNKGSSPDVRGFTCKIRGTLFCWVSGQEPNVSSSFILEVIIRHYQCYFSRKARRSEKLALKHLILNVKIQLVFCECILVVPTSVIFIMTFDYIGVALVPAQCMVAV